MVHKTTVHRVQYNDVPFTAQGVTLEAVKAKFGVTAGNTIVVAFAVSMGGITITPPDGAWVHSPLIDKVKFKPDLWYMIVDATQAGRATFVWTFKPSSMDAFSGVAHIEEWAGEMSGNRHSYMVIAAKRSTNEWAIT